MIRRAAAAVGAVVAAATTLLAAAPPAVAHQVDPSVVTVIDAVSPTVDGVRIEVGTSVTTQLLATNETDRVLEVLADTGEPFLRIGPDGVEANLASPSWYLTNQPFGGGAPPADARPGAPARWARVSTEPSWGWFDHRLHPAAIDGSLGEARLPRFSVPMRLGGSPLTVTGHLEPRTTVAVFAAALRGVPDPAEGLLVQLLDGRAPGLFVRYQGPGLVVVTGADGEPFLRLGPAGAEVNHRSPTWLFTAQARGDDLSGVAVDAAAAPEWAVVSASPSYAWIDPRAVIERVGSDPVSVDWVVPLDLDGRALEVRGRSTARLMPLSDRAGEGGGASSDTGRIVLVALAAAVTVGAVVGLGLHRRRGDEEPG